MKINIALRLLLSIIQALVFPLILSLGTVGYVQPSFAKNCILTSPPVINATIDVLAGTAGEKFPVINKIGPTAPIQWTCERDQATAPPAIANFCYRTDPTGGQIRDDYSHYLLGPGGSRLAFAMLGVDDNGANNGALSRNDNSLMAEGFAWNVGTPPGAQRVGDKFSHNADVWTVRPFGYMMQDTVKPGLYTGRFPFWIYQNENDPKNEINVCANRPFTSTSMAGMITININVNPNCLLENPVNIDFGQVSGIAATKQPTASGSVAIRCTTGTPYFISIDKGQNSQDGNTRRMKSADGKSFIPYQLCKEAACNTPFTTGTPISIGQGGTVNTATPVPIFAKLAPLAVVPAAGDYADTVVATVTF